MPMPGRFYSIDPSKTYRYGFQNQEKDDEIYGEGDAIVFEYRINDTRLGRFLSTDPLAASFPWNSPYAFSENRVTNSIELEGLEAHDLYGGESGAVDHSTGVQGPQPSSGPVGTVYGPYKNDAHAADAALSGNASVWAPETTVSDFRSHGSLRQGEQTTGQWFKEQCYHDGARGAIIYNTLNSAVKYYNLAVHRELRDIEGKNHGLQDAQNSAIQTLGLAAGPLARNIAALQEIQVTVNAFSRIGSTGAVGEAELQGLGGSSQEFFNTSLGRRYIDQFANGIANESKVGYTSLTSKVRLQIMKDVELIQTSQIRGATWHFFKSPITGKVGPSKPLIDFLESVGIEVIVH